MRDRKDWEWLERNGSSGHREKVQRKYQKIEMLRALIEEWEKREDWEYVRELRAKLRTSVCNLEAMRP